MKSRLIPALLAGNSDNRSLEVVLTVALTVAGRSDGGTLKATLPAQSINTFVVTP